MVTVTVNVCDSEGATTTQSMPVPVLALNAALISDAPSRPDPSAWCRGHGWALRKSIHHIVKALDRVTSTANISVGVVSLIAGTVW